MDRSEGFWDIKAYFLNVSVETLHRNVLYLYNAEIRCGFKYDYVHNVETRCEFKCNYVYDVERRCGATSLQGGV